MENKRLIEDIHQLLNEGKKKKEKKEKETEEGALNESGGPNEGPLEDVIHMIARAVEIGDKKMMNQAKNNMKGIPAELQSSLKLIMKSLG